MDLGSDLGSAVCYVTLEELLLCPHLSNRFKNSRKMKWFFCVTNRKERIFKRKYGMYGAHGGMKD